MNAAVCLVEIARYFHVLDGIELVKVDFEPGRVRATAINGDFSKSRMDAASLNGYVDGIATAVCFSELFGDFPDLSGCVGILHPKVLYQFSLVHEGIVPEIVQGESSPCDPMKEVKFLGSLGDVSYKRLTSASLASEQVQVPTLDLSSPEAIFPLDVQTALLMKKLAREAKQTGVERFWAFMNKRGRLSFSFDFSSEEDEVSSFEVASGLSYRWIKPYSYKAADVLSVLNMAMDCGRSVTMSLYNRGGAKIDVVSELGTRYEYLFFGTGELVDETKSPDYLKAKLARDMGIDATMRADWEPDL